MAARAGPARPKRRAHLAIARLAAHAPALTVITQNVDDLHERAGSRKYCICMAACTRRAAPIAAARPGAAPSPRALTPRQPAQRQPIPGQPTPRPAHRAGNRTKAAASSRRAAPLAAVPCGQASSVRRKPARRRLARGPARRRAMRSAAEHRHLGPGLSAAELPQRALATGAVVAQVNPAATPMDARVKFNLRGQAADVLPRLLQSAGI